MAGNRAALLRCVCFAALCCGAMVTHVQSILQSRIKNLTREELHSMDLQAYDYYRQGLHDLDAQNVTYEDYLLLAIKGIQHTIVVNHFDYKYEPRDVARQSYGASVDRNKCLNQLNVLSLMAKHALINRSKSDKSTMVPLSAINMFEATARVGSGVMNGNFLFWGGESSCEHVNIPTESIRNFVSKVGANAESKHVQGSESILGRYCMAHVKAKSWPVDDPYYADRLTLKIGVCLPQSCHTYQYYEDARIRTKVDYIVRHAQPEPFRNELFETIDLYCMPDEDSPHRAMDLGAKLFFAALIAWIVISIILNMKYQQRQRTLRKLRDTYDIRMIVDQKLLDSSQSHEATHTDCAQTKPTTNESNMHRTMEKINQRHFLDVDWVGAFALQANLKYLLEPREPVALKRAQSQGPQSSGVDLLNKQKLAPQSLSPSARRTSASNEALIKDLQQSEKTGKSPLKVEVVASSAKDASAASRAEPEVVSKPINMDVFDGIKAFLTCYIVYAHVFMFFFGLLDDIRYGDERMLDWPLIAVINALQVVNVFYIITGILTSYLLFSRHKLWQIRKPSLWILVIIGRYSRLLPAYLVVFWFARHVAPLTGSGSVFLEYRTDTENIRGLCASESWFTMLTLSSADMPLMYDCVPQAWYISTDFRTLFILPIFAILLSINTKLGYVSMISAIVLSIARMNTILAEAKIDYTMMMTWKPFAFAMLSQRLDKVYVDVLLRLSSYMFGMIVGHLLHLREKRIIKEWPAWFNKILVKLAMFIALATFMGAPILKSPYVNQYLPSREEIKSEDIVYVVPVFKAIMEICISIMFLSIASAKPDGWFPRLLSCRIAKILSTISYGVFLFHIEIMHKLHTMRFPSKFSNLYVYTTFIVMASFALSFIVHVMIEMPVNNVLRRPFKWAYNYFVMKA